MLFRRFQVHRDVVEAALGRGLRGDPSRGEQAIVALLNKGRLGDVRERLKGEAGEDFRGFLTEHLRAAERRWEEARPFRVRLRHEVWVFYAEEGRARALSLETLLSDAVERDFERRA